MKKQVLRSNMKPEEAEKILRTIQGVSVHPTYVTIGEVRNKSGKLIVHRGHDVKLLVVRYNQEYIGTWGRDRNSRERILTTLKTLTKDPRIILEGKVSETFSGTKKATLQRTLVFKKGYGRHISKFRNKVGDIVSVRISPFGKYILTNMDNYIYETTNPKVFKIVE